MRMPDDERDAAHLARQALERGAAVAIETSAQQKIFGRVAAQRELRSKHQVGTGGARTFAISEDLGGGAPQVADDTVDLGDRALGDSRPPASFPFGGRALAPAC